jgi:acyl carrier protein
MKHYEIVHDAAKSLRLLDSEGRLVRLDSLSILRFISAIESSSDIRIPTAKLRPEVFQSVETVARMLQDLAPG